MKTLKGTITNWTKELEGSNKKVFEQLLVNFSLRRCRVFFRSERFEIKEKEISIHVPDVVYEVQRRAQLRLKIDPDKKLFVQITQTAFAGPANGYQIYDISSGGVCLLVDGTQLDLWKTGKSQIQQMRFDIAERQIEIQQLRLVHSRPVPGQSNTFFVSFEFKAISNRDRCFINMFVYRESTEYVARILKDVA